jgi:hypothetical protein
VLDVLLLLAVARGLLEGLDDKGRGRGNDGNGGLTVLDGQLDSDPQTLPVSGGLGDIFTDLYVLLVNVPPPTRLWVGRHTLRRETKRTDLGGERGRGTDFTTSGTKVDDLDLGGIELGS